MHKIVKKGRGTTLPAHSITDVRSRRTVSSECKVCKAPALYSYYGAVVCQSCKIFFRRNADTRLNVLKCHFGDHCNINVTNRHICSACRLKKCFANGMCIEMFRCPRTKKIEKKLIIDSISSTSIACTMQKKNKKQPEQIRTLSLLQSDQSTLNIDQWNLLSNLIHCFDEHSGCLFLQGLLKDQNTFPFELHFEYSSVKDFFTTMKAQIEPVLGKNRDFLLLSSHDRTALFRTSVQYTTSVAAMFALRQHRLCDYPSFYKFAELIFRPTAVAFGKRVIDLLDPDDTFIRLILAALVFSTINYTLYKKNTLTNLANIKAIISIQDMYTELAWRYLLYKYNHREAVVRFSDLIRSLFLTTDSIVEAHGSQQYQQMIDSVIEQNEQKLCL